jgi:hypothetical protein
VFTKKETGLWLLQKVKPPTAAGGHPEQRKKRKMIKNDRYHIGYFTGETSDTYREIVVTGISFRDALLGCPPCHGPVSHIYKITGEGFVTQQGTLLKEIPRLQEAHCVNP